MNPKRTLRILIVDDVPVNLVLLNAMLHRFGVDCVSAGSGAEALKKFSASVFDAVMTDLWMPVMNGSELARTIRAGNSKIPIVAVTADVENSRNFDISMFSGVILKPLTLDAVRSLLVSLTAV